MKVRHDGALNPDIVHAAFHACATGKPTYKLGVRPRSFVPTILTAGLFPGGIQAKGDREVQHKRVLGAVAAFDVVKGRVVHWADRARRGARAAASRAHRRPRLLQLYVVPVRAHRCHGSLDSASVAYLGPVVLCCHWPSNSALRGLYVVALRSLSACTSLPRQPRWHRCCPPWPCCQHCRR